jgi:hypothetical protein
MDEDDGRGEQASRAQGGIWPVYLTGSVTGGGSRLIAPPALCKDTNNRMTLTLHDGALDSFLHGMAGAMLELE